jgi:N-acetylmuramoyl-L-alanine amidase
MVFPVLLALLATTGADAAEITALRSWRAPDNTRLVLDLSGPLKYRLSPDSTPARLIVELDDAQIAGPIALPSSVGPLRALRFEKNGSGQRLIIETTVELSPKIFQLPPNEKYGNRLVLDLYDKNAAGAAAQNQTPPPPSPAVTAPAASEKNAVAEKNPAGEKPAEPVAKPELAEKPAEKQVEKKPEAVAPVTAPVVAPVAVPGVVAPPVPVVSRPEKPVAESKPLEKNTGDKTAGDKKPVEAAARPEPVQEKYDPKRYRNIIVAIDAGHGGEDPGASGANGTHEKDVTLAIARELEAQLKSEPGITPVLVRSGDYFIPLQDRRRIARYQHKADIFVSIHADAAPSRAAKGASVFALSLKGANTATSRFARMLAERENRADLIGGAAIENEDDVLRNVLADMVVAGSLEHSLHMGRNILNGLDRLGPLHSRNVEQAGFAVLKEPGMVSLLVETGFISNPDEEKKLTNKQYQKDLARAVFDGVRRYCVQYPAPGTYFAWLSDKTRAPSIADRSAERAADKNAEKSSASASSASQAPTVANAVDKSLADKPALKKAAAPKFVKHKVARGENLTRLAAQYQVSMDQLRELNRLRDDNVKIGQVLKIPAN